MIIFHSNSSFKAITPSLFYIPVLDRLSLLSGRAKFLPLNMVAGKSVLSVKASAHGILLKTSNTFTKVYIFVISVVVVLFSLEVGSDSVLSL